MPGNKNSGRKKRIKQNVQQEDAPIQKKKTPGRPKKEVTVALSDTSFAQCLQTGIETETLHNTSSRSLAEQMREDRSVPVFHSSNLQKRNSDMNILYDSFLGPSIQNFPSSKLPMQRTILQRYRALRTESAYTSQLSDIITIITKEVRELWTFSCIPTRDYCGCWSIVKQCVSKWVEAKQDMKKSSKFQKDLNTLLDCRPVTCKRLSSLKQALIKTGNPNWGIDYEFFKGQLKVSSNQYNVKYER